MDDIEFMSCVFTVSDFSEKLDAKFCKKVVRAYRLKLEEIFDLPSEKFYPGDKLKEFGHHAKRDWDFMEFISCIEDVLEIPVEDDDYFPFGFSIGTWLQDLWVKLSEDKV
ncbi:MAG: hypothetical protein J7642_11930 [Cyanobacteria bacterium SBC]|nr:hypothetical protein [Cyanobacteria bacterium SBC]